MESKYTSLKMIQNSISSDSQLKSSAAAKRIWGNFFEKGHEAAISGLSSHENRRKLMIEMTELDRHYKDEAPELFAKTIRYSLGGAAAGWIFAAISSCTDATLFVPKTLFDIAVLGSGAFGLWSLRIKDAALAVSDFSDGAKEFSSSVWKQLAKGVSE